MLLLPALIALRRILPAVIGPPLATYVIWRALPYHVPLLLAILLCLLSLPLYYSASNAWRLFQNARQAEKLGARLPPLVEDNSWIGSVAPRALLANFERGYLGDHLFEWTRKYGWTIRLNMFGETVIQTNEPEYIKAILATNFVGFEKNTQARFLDDILGSGVFNSNGEVWKFHRGITRPFFSRDRISDFEVFDRHTLLALKSLQTRLSAGHPVDFQDLVSRFTIDSATAFLFGTDVRSLHAGLPYPGADPEAEAASNPADAFATAFLAAQLHVARRTRFGLAWPLFEIFDTKHAENLRTIRQFIEPLVNKAIKRVESANTDSENSKDVQEGETMLDYMVKSTRDPSLLYDETLNILLAGRDTTASLLTSTVYALSQHPEVLAKLRAEILAVVGSQRAPTPDDFRQMKFLRAVLNEVLRLWPPVPFNSRKTIDATVWPAKEPGSKPFYIPPETRVLYSVYVMHRRTDLWGPDALSFDPERFLDERIKYITSNNFMFLPFNAGPRICLGQQFAYNEASFFLVRLLQQYSGVQLAPDAQPATSKPVWEGREKVWMKSHFTLYAAGGLWTRFTPASEDA